VIQNIRGRYFLKFQAVDLMKHGARCSHGRQFYSGGSKDAVKWHACLLAVLGGRFCACDLFKQFALGLPLSYQLLPLVLMALQRLKAAVFASVGQAVVRPA
jgi:hypothetical protein